MRPLIDHRTCLGTILIVAVNVGAAACASNGGGGHPMGGNLAADTARTFTRNAVNAPPIAVLADSTDQPFYPDGMRLAEIEGDVTAEFIVDSVGHIDNSSIRIVTTSDARLTKSVTTWLTGRRFSPARKDGRAMAARTSQDFHFGLTRLKGNVGDSGASRNNAGLGGAAVMSRPPED